MKRELSYSLNVIDKLSFWNFHRASVCFASVFSSNIQFNLKQKNKTYSRSQLVGIAFHEIIESFHRGNIKPDDYESFLACLDEIKKKFKLKFPFENYKPLDEWSEIEDVFEYICMMEPGKNGDNSKVRYLFEEELYSLNQKLYGRLDLLVVGENKIKLYEFKSGRIRDESGYVKEEYVKQVYFYSYLVRESFGKYPDEIIISGMKEGEVNINLDESHLKSVVELAYSILEGQSKRSGSVSNLNDLTLDDFYPNSENCRFCKLKPFCPEYKKIESVEDHGCTLVGKLKCVNGEENKKFIEVEVVTLGQSVIVKNVPSSNVIDFLSIDTFLVFDNLKKTGNNTYECTYWSEVACYD